MFSQRVKQVFLHPLPRREVTLPYLGAIVIGRDGARIQAENQTTKTGSGWTCKTPLTEDPSIKNAVQYGLGLGRAGRGLGDSEELAVPIYLANT